MNKCEITIDKRAPFFSILVPVFNAEKYIRECLDSILAQSFRSWEAILVDDGSTDASGIICDEYRNKDSRFVVIHKVNGGEFSARKAGLDIARGRYITAVDPDDYFLPQRLQNIYDCISASEADCIVTGCSYCGQREDNIDSLFVDEYIRNREKIIEGVINNLNNAMWNKAIRKECFDKTDYNDVPKVRFSEDEIMLFPVLCNIDSIYGLRDYTYKYRIHDSAVSKNNALIYIQYMNDVIEYDIHVLKTAGMNTDLLIDGLYWKYWNMVDIRMWDLFLKKRITKQLFRDVKKMSLYQLAHTQARKRMAYISRMRLLMLDYNMYHSLKVIAFCTRNIMKKKQCL